MNNDNVQRYIVRQSCLNRATDILTSQMIYDKAVQEADYETLKTMVYGLAQDFEAWVFREGLSSPAKSSEAQLKGNTTTAPVKKKAGLRTI